MGHDPDHPPRVGGDDLGRRSGDAGRAGTGAAQGGARGDRAGGARGRAGRLNPHPLAAGPRRRMMNRMLSDVAVPPRPVARLEPVVGAARYANLLTAAAAFRTAIAGRTIWNVNSTAAGGGVAEMLQCLVGYVNDLDI